MRPGAGPSRFRVLESTSRRSVPSVWPLEPLGGESYYDPTLARDPDRDAPLQLPGWSRSARLDVDGTLTVNRGTGLPRREFVMHTDGSV